MNSDVGLGRIDEKVGKVDVHEVDVRKKSVVRKRRNGHGTVSTKIHQGSADTLRIWTSGYRHIPVHR